MLQDAWKGRSFISVEEMAGMNYSENIIRGSLAFYYLGYRLALEPIIESTGQQESVYERPRTYADVQDEIANSLVNQPRFTATCKVVDHNPRQFAIRTTRAIVLDESHSFVDIERIRSESRLAFCKERAQVEAEIRARQGHQGDGDSPHERRSPV